MGAPKLEAPPELEIQPLRRPGKPRRGSAVAEVSSVRLDPETKARLQANFGTLGDALYFIAQGINQFRAIHDTYKVADAYAPGPLDPDDLLPAELEAVQSLIYKHLDKLREQDPYVTPLFRALRKIERRAGKP